MRTGDAKQINNGGPVLVERVRNTDVWWSG